MLHLDLNRKLSVSVVHSMLDPEEDKGYPGCVAENRPEVLEESEGEIKSPLGAGGKYPNHAECHWRISVPQGKVSW